MAGQTHVLTFGCARTQKMFRALIPGPVPRALAKTPLVVIPRCPGCGDEHAVLDTFSRPFRPGDAIDVSLAGYVPPPVADAPPVAPPLSTHDRNTTKIPDSDLLAAIPTDQPALAADIARALGYALTFTLVERLERLNSRAVRTWGHPAVQIIRTDTGRCPTYLQRIEHQPANKEVPTA
jgi:hypothetical protein